MTAFELLGLPATASCDEVKQAWRELAATHHPDRGGDSAEFAKYRRAYEDAFMEAAKPKLCPTCQGSGHATATSGWSSIALLCPACQGAGTST